MIKFASCNDFIELKCDYNSNIISEHMAWTLKQFDILHIVKFINENKPGRVLEVGGGLELYFDKWLANACEYHMIDKPGHFYSEQLFDEISQKRNNTYFINGLMGEFTKGVSQNYYDLIFSVGSVLTSTPANIRTNALKEMFDALKPGGTMIHFIHLHMTKELTLAQLLIQDSIAAGFLTGNVSLDWSLWDDPILLETLEMVYDGYLTSGSEDRWTNRRHVQYQYGDLIMMLNKP